ncbi:MAG: acylphosphatase [Patescibacteria group bacterium]|nr:acylphosphatase [Patescibacteria group bacterium]
MDKHIIIQISGRVHGVWFRKSAQDVAQELGLVGFTRNNSDGTVTIEACGTEAEIKQLIKWCHEGSKSARVDDVKYIIDDKSCNYKDFKIL